MRAQPLLTPCLACPAPHLACTASLCNSQSADWNQLWAGVYGEGRNILQQTQYVNQCWDSVRAGALTNPK